MWVVIADLSLPKYIHSRTQHFHTGSNRGIGEHIQMSVLQSHQPRSLSKSIHSIPYVHQVKIFIYLSKIIQVKFIINTDLHLIMNILILIVILNSIWAIVNTFWSEIVKFLNFCKHMNFQTYEFSLILQFTSFGHNLPAKWLL